jgi:hypothetical protein
LKRSPDEDSTKSDGIDPPGKAGNGRENAGGRKDATQVYPFSPLLEHVIES